MQRLIVFVLAAVFVGASSNSYATDRFWSGGGGSDDITDGNNWYSPGKPTGNAGDNLTWNNTVNNGHQYSNFNYGDYSRFGTITFYDGARGGQLYGNALQFTTRLENDGSPQWRIYNSNVAAYNDGTGNFAVNPISGDLYVKLDNLGYGASGNGGNGSGGSFYLNGLAMNVYGNNSKLLTLECILANGTGVNGAGNTGSFILQQNSQVRFTGAFSNTYTGPTTLNAGTLYLSKTNGATAIAGDVIINTSSSRITMEASNQIADTSLMRLNGGTFNANGFSEGTAATVGVGALTLQSSSVISLGSTGLLHFANSAAASWSGTLSVYNWNGTSGTGGGACELLFGTNTSGLTQQQLNSISFYSDNGTTFLGTGGFASIGDGEIVPVPEPATIFGGCLLVGLVAWRKREALGQACRHMTSTIV